MKRGRDVMARKKQVQRRLDRAAYSTLEPTPFDVYLKAGLYAERNNLEEFSNRTVKVVWPKHE
ncbi:MAG TPA: hypothetical protein VII92_15970 [Anaerolineae bacterium]